MKIQSVSLTPDTSFLPLPVDGELSEEIWEKLMRLPIKERLEALSQRALLSHARLLDRPARDFPPICSSSQLSPESA